MGHYISTRWQTDIFFRLWAVILLAVTLASGVNTVVSVQSLRIDADLELNDRVENMANVLSKALARPLFDLNSIAIASVGDAMGVDAQVVKMRVVGPDGAVLVDAGLPAPQDVRTVSVRRDIHYTAQGKSYLVGHLEAALSGESIDRKFRLQTIHAVTSGLILILTITLALYLVGKKLTRPFDDIQLALDRLTHGETDVELSGIARADQIGRLSVAVGRFRTTLHELRAAKIQSALLLDEKSNALDKLNAIYEGSNDAVMLLTDQGFFDCNQRTLDMFGVAQRSDFSALHPSDISPPQQPDGRDSATAAGEKIQQAFLTGECRFEWVHSRIDGSVFPAEVLLSAFDYEGRRVLQATVRDITQRKRIEQELHELNTDLEARIEQRTQEMRVTLSMLAENRQKLQGIVDTALDAVVRVDATGTIVGWNRQAETVFGWSTQEALGRTLHDTIIPTQHRAAHLHGMARFMRTNVSKVIDQRIEISALHRSGHEFPIELAITRVVLEDSSKFEFCSFIRDITQRKRAEEEIRASLEQQKELNQLKSRFVAMASHEFRTPLATILLSTDLLKHYIDRLPVSERDELFQSINHAVRRMTKMLEDILTIGKAEAEQAQFNPSVLAIDVFCRELVEQVLAEQDSLGTKRSQVNLTIQGDCKQARFDEKLLRHIFENLLSNAAKYSPDGAVVDFQVVCTPQSFVFTVADRGIGVPPKDLPRLFESFHRASNVGNIAGTGLGLAIVKRSVELHAGSISVSSVLGEGTTFVVTLPRIENP
jgi:PAS domain S-box-containing protein